LELVTGSFARRQVAPRSSLQASSAYDRLGHRLDRRGSRAAGDSGPSARSIAPSALTPSDATT